MRTKLSRWKPQIRMCYTFFSLSLFFVPQALCDITFHTIEFTPTIREEISKVDSQHEEQALYMVLDSIGRRRGDVPGILQSDTIPTVKNNGNIEKVRLAASRQMVYYESLIDSLMFENFRLKMELAVISRNTTQGYMENIGTGFIHDVVSSDVMDDLTIDNLILEIQRAGLKHPKVVLAQAILETGWFKSRVCHTHNNLFGLRQPWDGEYFRFDRWQDSVRAYGTKVQYKYKGGPYLKWLDELGYAEDPQYTAKLAVLLSGPLKDL